MHKCKPLRRADQEATPATAHSSVLICPTKHSAALDNGSLCTSTQLHVHVSLRGRNLCGSAARGRSGNWRRISMDSNQSLARARTATQERSEKGDSDNEEDEQQDGARDPPALVLDLALILATGDPPQLPDWLQQINAHCLQRGGNVRICEMRAASYKSQVLCDSSLRIIVCYGRLLRIGKVPVKRVLTLCM